MDNLHFLSALHNRLSVSEEDVAVSRLGLLFAFRQEADTSRLTDGPIYPSASEKTTNVISIDKHIQYVYVQSMHNIATD